MSSLPTRWATVRERLVPGQPVYTLAPGNGASVPQVGYTRGGAYLNPLRSAHGHIVGQPMRATGATVTDASLAPAPEGEA